MLRHHRNGIRSKAAKTPRVSPLDIPEILERILLCLSRRTLKRVARVVCRQWFLLSRRLIPQRLHSLEKHTSHEQRCDDILSLLRTATTVHWTISTEDFCDGRLMTEQLRKKYSAKDHLDTIIGRNDDSELTSIQVLDLTIDASSFYVDIYFKCIRSMLSGLTCLDISDASRIDLAPLFTQCPNLLRLRLVNLEINCNGSLNFELPALPRLRSLTLERCATILPDLNILLSALPSLQEARLQLRVRYYEYASTYSRAEMEPRFLEVLKDRCGELKAFTFSHSAQLCYRPEFIQQVINHVAPNATEWGLDARSMNTTNFGRLLHRSSTARNIVTRLDLTLSNPSERFYPSASGLLAYLRASPHLLHLNAPDITLTADEIDPFNGLLPFPYRTITPYNLSPRSSPMAAWACRGLQTLKITLLRKYVRTDEIFERSRTIFGFLSRTCPKLRELDVVIRSPSLCLESGFCLLSRMTRLEKLNITLDHPHRHSSELPEMEWLVAPSVRTLQWRLYQAWKVSRSTKAWRATMKVEKETIEQRRSIVATTHASCNLIAGKGVKWEDNGALTDVWNVLNQLAGANQKADPVWPLLSQLYILLNLHSRKAMSDLIHEYRPWVDTSISD
ncbi:hypothetical protein BGZ81_004807 [Podila clonocystis]|nr:hypothetical protein BGZ81_004807 [Podila clonocystis]